MGGQGLQPLSDFLGIEQFGLGEHHQPRPRFEAMAVGP